MPERVTIGLALGIVSIVAVTVIITLVAIPQDACRQANNAEATTLFLGCMHELKASGMPTLDYGIEECRTAVTLHQCGAL